MTLKKFWNETKLVTKVQFRQRWRLLLLTVVVRRACCLTHMLPSTLQEYFQLMKTLKYRSRRHGRPNAQAAPSTSSTSARGGMKPFERQTSRTETSKHLTHTRASYERLFESLGGLGLAAILSWRCRGGWPQR